MARTTEVTIEPLTRIEGHMGVHAQADLEGKKYTEAHCYATMFRGLEDILKGREPADAIWLAQRSCGVCPTPHATAAVLAVDMAYGAPPPPLAIGLRDLATMGEEVYDGALGLRHPGGSGLLRGHLRQGQSRGPGEGQPYQGPARGYARLYHRRRHDASPEPHKRKLLAQVPRGGQDRARYCQHHLRQAPAPEQLCPGGIARTVTISDIEAIYILFGKEVAFTKELTAFFDDLIDFLSTTGLEKVGVLPLNFLSYGVYDDPLSYNARYADMSTWGAKRWVTPGIVINGKLITNDLVEINVGVQETVTHSYYEDTEARRVPERPPGQPAD